MTDTTAAQVMVTPEFEEKVRQAIAAVSNTPVSSSRLVLVTHLLLSNSHHVQRAVTSLSLLGSSGSGPCSARLRGSPRPSSGAPPATVRVDTVLLPAQDSLVLEEGIAEGVTENDYRDEAADVLVPALGSAEESETADNNTVANEAARSDIDGVKPADKQIMFSWYTGALVSKESDDNANDVDQSPIKAVEGVSMEVEGAASTVAATTDELVDPAALDKNTFMTALKIQCKIRSFLARRRVQAKREELQKKHVIPNENLPASDVIASTTPVVSKAVENEETLYYAQILYPPSNTAPTEEMPISAHREVDAAPSSGPSPTIATQKQHPHAALVSTRLPSVLDVTRYFLSDAAGRLLLLPSLGALQAYTIKLPLPGRKSILSHLLKLVMRLNMRQKITTKSTKVEKKMSDFNVLKSLTTNASTQKVGKRLKPRSSDFWTRKRPATTNVSAKLKRRGARGSRLNMNETQRVAAP
ncbi:hypothetical protein GN244_ATG19645 [Phytophthora infestans]|uniref:Uncharacterized protein n=1 Tax=Phytophthora infestans TaxID=4787 RepID=A0A833SGD3_PHYIN|nr:hypothetical protein GN244_ATG19645 [Phytophthora infestans]